MFVLNPDMYSLPSYRIGPFRTSDIKNNYYLKEDDSIDGYFEERFTGRSFFYTYNGRAAIHAALSYYNLQENDVVTILTTTGNFYISSCVTKEIEKFCKWSRKIELNTKVIFVNHEFGYPFENIDEIKKYGVPIIEDCCTTFFSQDKFEKVGTVGEFVIYSFPKFFPIQIGGLLVTSVSSNRLKLPVIDDLTTSYIKKVMSYYITQAQNIINKRLANYQFIKDKLEVLGLAERFPLHHKIVPSVFMFKKGKHKIELQALKNHMNLHGIQCSVFYGEDSFFVPAHQALEELDMLYIIAVIQDFIKIKSHLTPL